MILAVIIICLLIWAFCIYAEQDDAWTLIIPLSIAGAIVSGFILLGTWMQEDMSDGELSYQRYEMQAITTGKDTSGTFFLGSGGFSEDAKYYFYAEVGDGFKMYSEYVENAIIKTDAEPGTAWAEWPCATDSMARWPQYPLNIGTEEETECSTWFGDIIFHVPPDSITYNVDLSLPE